MQESYLRLTGPTRGVVTNIGPSYLAVVLKVKGLTKLEDKYLNKFAMTYSLCPFDDAIEYTSKLCTLEMQHYTVLSSVEGPQFVLESSKGNGHMVLEVLLALLQLLNETSKSHCWTLKMMNFLLMRMALSSYLGWSFALNVVEVLEFSL